jgi:hypothetical protein
VANVVEHKHGGAAAQRLYIDNGDGTYAETEASRLYAYDVAGLVWVKVNVDTSGNLLISSAPQSLLFASVSAASSGDNTIVAADTTRKIKVVSYVLVAAGTVNTTWKSGAGTSLSGALPLVSNTGAAMVGTGDSWLLETAVNQALVLNLSGAIQVSGHISYYLKA